MIVKLLGVLCITQGAALMLLDSVRAFVVVHLVKEPPFGMGPLLMAVGLMAWRQAKRDP